MSGNVWRTRARKVHAFRGVAALLSDGVQE